ncbi:endo-1,4-beta-xylanase [Rhizomicrobium palustre]|uniref:Alpha-L-arabinofuranosidase n=1 Tax=Rhizomicrobium palustre TaxID=189966 RepID=A0A846MZ93_9PROT|nr:non-reducing end alpha-L-arabinofuranosidase family hydrolase [Rhizomicrobium palustre]NIK88633.1 endo-1,4-beta-xylanase [Rhizomicrobium palustre]
MLRSRLACCAFLALTALPAFAAEDGQFQWKSTAPLILPKPDAAHASLALKDPTVVFANGKFHVFATTPSEKGGWEMAYLSFTDWAKANDAPITYLNTSKIGPGYHCAPQVFYFAPQKLWYLVYQGNGAMYSTTSNIDDPMSWSAPKTFFSKMPDTVKDAIGKGYWLDFWNICDEKNCYLFGADDNGHIFRSKTTLADFPNGYDKETVIAAAEPNKADLFEAAMIYKIKGTEKYLAAVEAMGPKGRYFRSWTLDKLDSEWKPLAAKLDDAFASALNVRFDGAPSSEGVSHGELIRTNADQTPEVDFCKPLQFLYQALEPNAPEKNYLKLPYRLSLLTATKQPDLGLCAAKK